MGKMIDFELGRLTGTGVADGVGAPGQIEGTDPKVGHCIDEPSATGDERTFFLETFGCQMNEHDSEKVAGVLLEKGYRQVKSTELASVILYNTCSIREKAAQKVFSRLGEWRPVGELAVSAAGPVLGPRENPETEPQGDPPEDPQREPQRDPPESPEREPQREPPSGPPQVPEREPDPAPMSERSGRSRVRALQTVGGARKIIGVLGCVAQQEGEEIFERAPWVSLVCGSASYRKLPQMLAELEAGNTRVTGLDTDTTETFETEMTRRTNPWRAYLTIIEGCDKSCAYCVVPFTRGPERSRGSASILEEVKRLAGSGYKEIQLLGQTVNSYQDPTAKKMRFSDLLVAVAEVEGIKRVRFTTSHPNEFGKDIVDAMEAVPGVCNHVHLPAQSGSSSVLKAMARTYTREEYLEKIAMIRAAKRPMSITTDLIVGFPGETEKDVEETLSLMDAVQYDGSFTFKYSPRPNTPSLKMADAIPEEETGRRLALLQARQREIQTARNALLVGERFEVMVEGKSRRENRWMGRTSCNRVVNFTSPEQEVLGDYVQVEVVDGGPNNLAGVRVVR
jgi:tRNA-2-methylthio-N6-dimethylallyladenosine synthase